MPPWWLSGSDVLDSWRRNETGDWMLHTSSASLLACEPHNHCTILYLKIQLFLDTLTSGDTIMLEEVLQLPEGTCGYCFQG